MDTFDKQSVIDGNQLLRETYRQPLAAVLPVPKTIFQRIYAGDPAAAKDCLDSYGNLVWAIAKKFMGSNQEAELFSEKIFEDIWKFARIDRPNNSDRKIIEQIALRRIIRHQWESRNMF